MECRGFNAHVHLFILTYYFQVIINLGTPGHELVLFSQDSTVAGTIMESENTNINRRGLELPEGFNGRGYINLVELLTHLIKVCPYFITYLILSSILVYIRFMG